MKQSKIPLIILSLLSLLIILVCGQENDIHYPNFKLDDLFKAYPRLPPLDIIPGKTLLTPSTSIDDLTKDLDIMNSYFLILTQDALFVSDWIARYDLFRQYAFLKLIKYKNLNIENQDKKKLLDRYLQIGKLIVPKEEYKKVHDTISKGIKMNKKYDEEFKNEIANGPPITIERDVELQNKWKSMSESSGLKMKLFLDNYLKAFDEMAKKHGKAIGINDTLSFWMYYTEYDFLSTNEVKKLWNTELRYPYQKFMNYMRDDFSDLYKNYTNMKENGPMPAYIFDLILLSYSVAAYENFEGYTNKQITKRLEHMSLLDQTRARNYNVRTMTKSIDEFFQSIGFPKLKASFWKKSVFENVGHDVPIEISLSGESDHVADFALEIRAPATLLSYQKISQVILDHHRMQSMTKARLPRILWDFDNQAFQEAFFKVVMMCATSVRRLTTLGFIEKDPQPEDNLEWFKGTAVAVFTGLAFTVSSNTWKVDMIKKSIGPKDRLAEYWERRKKFEWVVPKTHSPEDVDTHDLFDIYIGTKVLENSYDLDYFWTTILQYQIFARFCELTGYYNPKKPLENPLTECDYSGNAEVANIIRSVTSYGGLKPWRELLDIIMGKSNSTISAKGLLHYFAPIFSFIDKKNKEAKKQDDQK